MKVVNESTGHVYIRFTYPDGHSGCGWIEAGGDPVERSGVAKVEVTVGAPPGKPINPIVYEDFPENAVVIVSSSIESD